LRLESRRRGHEGRRGGRGRRSGGNDDSAETLREKMRQFYKIHNKSKLSSVESLAAKHESKPYALMRALHRKYKPGDPPIATDVEVARDAVDGKASEDYREMIQASDPRRFVEMMQAAKMRIEFKVDETVRKMRTLERASEISRRRADIVENRWRSFCTELQRSDEIERRMRRIRSAVEGIRVKAKILEDHITEHERREGSQSSAIGNDEGKEGSARKATSGGA